MSSASASVALPLPAPRAASLSIGLWVFIGVASALFMLFLAAYMMRMDQAADWTRLALPRQLWLSTALVRWLKWGWSCYSSGGCWRAWKRKRVEVAPAPEPPGEAATPSAP